MDYMTTSDAVVAQDDWYDIEETMFVMQNKDLSKALLKGINTPYEECSECWTNIYIIY